MINSTKPTENKSDSTIKSVHKALDIIDFLADSSHDVSVTELSEQLQINKSTISKMLSTLDLHGYVRQNPQTHRYRIGFKPMLLAQKTKNNMEIQSIAEPFLLHLRDITGETVNFALYSNLTLTYVATFEGLYPVRLSSTAGMRASLTSSAVGKAALAFLHEPDRSSLLSEVTNDMLPPEKENFIKNIEVIRRRGFSINIDELTKGVSGVGAPIFDYSGKMVAAVAVAGLSVRMDNSVLNSFGSTLLDSCNCISKELGGHPAL